MSNPPAYKDVVNPNSKLSFEQLLSGYNMFLLFDQSGSMSGPVSRKHFNMTRWQALREAATTIAATVDHIDADGSTVLFFNSGVSMFDNRKAADIDALFASRQPNGMTNLAAAMREVFAYLRREFDKNKNYKALVVIVTDGMPCGDDGADQQTLVGQLIADFTKYMSAKGLTDEQVGITFIQVGDDPNATRYLQYLDDKLNDPVSAGGLGAEFDIVDTINFADVDAAGGIVQAFVKAFND